MPKLKMRMIVHPHLKHSVMKGEFHLEGDVTHLTRDFNVAQLIFDIERALNEHVKGLRVHATFEDN